ncbi:GDSL esterase/lipase At4g26790-like [Phragmites australis]|uniref:GDSL esterase/lipase At4g26790-like n=1 Tax=Phragmites australis TaxID=29695 RepID=UPI002D7A1212|nr:GDSL esterase/lipase At4g26790-like [Phragmites australis]
MASPPGHRRARVSQVALLLALCCCCCGVRGSPPASPSPKVPAVIVFGDSTVDTGNNNVIGTILKSNFPPYGRDMDGGGRATGRFCNGRLPPDFISEALGLPPLVPAYLDPAYGIQDFARGVCFASAGTGLDNATAGVLSVIPVWKEVEYFKEYQRRLRRHVGRARAKRIVSDALYIVSIGTNDFLENYFLFVTGRFAQFTVGEFEDFLVAQAEWFLAEIHRLGARRVTFAGLSPIGCLPLERTLNTLRGGCVEEYNQVARDYNVKVLDMLRRLRASRPGLKVAYVNVYENMLDLINNPSTLGLENVEEGCCATGKLEMSYLCNDASPMTCEDAGRYFFWDSFHPTEKVNQFFAKETLDLCYKELL